MPPSLPPRGRAATGAGGVSAPAWLLTGVLLLCLVQAGWLWRARSLPRLDRGPVPQRAAWPALSVVVPARNEARSLEAALRALLALDYPGLEIIVVDDRSEDATPAILAAVAAEYPALRCCRVDVLPEGWLGKNHALQRGAGLARGRWLLFTDADVVLRADCLRRVVDHVERESLDHLALLVRVHSRSAPVRAFIAFFGWAFMLHLRPWRVSDPAAEEYVGIGAFNLVRRELYTRMGGHHPIRLRPDDDIRLGQMIKWSGGRSGCASGVRLGSVEWYTSWAETLRGLEKNLYAGVDYRLLPALGAVLAPVLLMTLPLAGLFSAEPLIRWLAGAVYVLQASMVASVSVMAGLGFWPGLVHPLCAAAFSFVMARTLWLTLRRGGVRWRGTFYPLARLRAQRLRRPPH